jgi:LysM repeat protein
MEKDMTDKDKESAQDVIEAYRKRQKKAQKAPILLGVAAGLLVVGAAALIFWLVGPGLPQISFLATDTPTPTQTFTPTSTSTATLIPTETPTSTATPTVTLTPTLPGPFVYEVLENDSLFTIAEKFKVDLLVLIAINNLDATNPIIRVGDKLTIPGPDTQLPTSSPIPLSMRRGTLVEYTVQTGDTLAIIADKFNSTVDDIVKENELTDPNAIFVGQKLNIPVNLVTPVPSSTPGPSLTPSATVTATP